MLIFRLLLSAQPLLCLEKQDSYLIFLFNLSFFHILHLIISSLPYTYQPSVQVDLPCYFISTIYHLIFYLYSLSTLNCLLAPQHRRLTSFLVWYYCSPSHPCSLTLFLSFFLNTSLRIDLTKYRALLLPYRDSHFTDPVPGSMSQQTMGQG